MTRLVIERGIDVMSKRNFNKAEWSGKVYLADPRDGRLWDLKIALRVAAEKAGIELYPGFTSDRYRSDLLKAGVGYVHFKHDKKRALGVCGNDLSELLDDHDLYIPDGRIQPMGACAKETYRAHLNPELFFETREVRKHVSYESRCMPPEAVKAARGLVCEACGLDAEKRYGRKLASRVIEAHHLTPRSEIPDEGRMVTTDDFRVLCASCHRLIHGLNRLDDLEPLRKLVRAE